MDRCYVQFLTLVLLGLFGPTVLSYRTDVTLSRQGCSWTGRTSATNKNIGLNLLDCSVRTLTTDFGNATLSPDQKDRTNALRIQCNDKLFFESFLPTNGQLFQLRNLESITIESCKVRRLGPQSWKSLGSLRNLVIRSHNADWSSSVGMELDPNAFQGVSARLMNLDLSWNNIWTLPSPFLCHDLRQLQALNLSHNALSELPEELGDGSPRYSEDAACALNLVILDLSYNTIRKIGRNAFSRLRTLTHLRIHQNYIEELDDSAFYGLNHLKVLNMSTNRLVALPPTIFTTNRNLREIYLQNNSISVLAPALFAGLENLQLLDLSRNSLSSIWVKENVFGHLARLVVLRLSFNQLAYIDPTLFSNLVSLQALHLDNNRIENLNPQAFAALTNLQLLDISRNRLSLIDSRLFSATFLLRQLYLDHNKIRTMDEDSLKNCTGLQDLGLAGNSLTEVPLAVRTGLGLLRTLDIGENRISGLSNESFAGLGSLYGLRLVDNRVSEVPTGFCDPLKKLRVLNFAQNRIGKLASGAFTGCPELRALRLDTNLLEELPSSLTPQLPSLLWLNVSENRLRWADHHLLPPTIEWLDLSYNALESLGGGELPVGSKRAGPYHLRVLDASHNRLTRLDYTTIPPTLETLRVNHNHLKTVAPDTFSRSLRLRRLELIGNQLESLPLSALRFPTVPIGSQLPEAYLGGNPFACDCTMEWLTRVNQLTALRQHPKIMDLDAIVCKPTYSRTTELIALPDAKPSDFLCPYTAHCFPLCQCCEFEACDCAMTCPDNCTCFHDTAWSTNIVECSTKGYANIPERIPMDATEIYLDGNEMGTLGSHIFIGKKNLRVLYLNSSGVEVIRNKTFNGLKSLEILRLDSNRMSVLHGYEFSDLENLKELYLQNNSLTSIAAGTFSRLRFLQVLRLDGNQLIDFSVWELSGNGYLNSVMLSGNPWTCDCEFILPFRSWVSSRTSIVVDFSLAKCQPVNDSDGTGLLDTARPTISSLCNALEDITENYKSIEPVEMLGNHMSSNGAAEKRTIGGMSPAGTQDEDDSSELSTSSSMLWTAIVLSICVILAVIVVLVIFRKTLTFWCCYRSGPKREGILPRWLTALNKKPVPEDENEKLFDAYFLYAPADEEVVTQKLIPEVDRSLRLCLHRDLCMNLDNPWNPEMINSASEASRRIVVLLSKSLLQSGVNLQSLSRYQRKLVFIVLPPFTEQSLKESQNFFGPSGIPADQGQILQWNDVHFWTNFKKRLPSPSPVEAFSLRRPLPQHPSLSEPEWPYTNFSPPRLTSNLIQEPSKDLWSHPHHHGHVHQTAARRIVPIPPAPPYQLHQQQQLLHPLLFQGLPPHSHHFHEHQNSVSTISNTYRPLTEQEFSDSTNTLGSGSVSNDEDTEHVYSTLDTPMSGSPAKGSTDSGVSSNPNGSGPMYFV